MLTKLVEFVTVAIIIIVVAIPEGLPMAVTMALAFSMFQMMKDQNLVRKLEACETMGGATSVCCDKTGTLTENRMTAMKAWFAFREFHDLLRIKEELHQRVFDIIAEGISVNSTAFISKLENHRVEYVGSQTECALLQWMVNVDYDHQEIRNNSEIVEQYPFSSKTKRMGTLIKKHELFQFHCKGAPEILLELCSSALDELGNSIPFGEGEKQRVIEKSKEMATEDSCVWL